MATATTTFTRTKETKGTYVYTEDEHAEHDTLIGTLYVKKFAIKQLGNPERIQITVEAK